MKTQTLFKAVPTPDNRIAVTDKHNRFFHVYDPEEYEALKDIMKDGKVHYFYGHINPQGNLSLEYHLKNLTKAF